MTAKECKKCGETKPVSEFGVRSKRPDTQCKSCRRAYEAAWRAANPDKVAAKMQRHRHGSGRAKYLATVKSRNAQMKPKRAAIWTEYYARNGDKVRAARAKRYDPEKKRTSRDKERTREYWRRWNARKQAAFVEAVNFDDILTRDCGLCGICGKPIMEKTIELDHVIPLAAGGTHEPDNVQIAHRTCNRRKSAKVGFDLRDAAYAVRAVAPD